MLSQTNLMQFLLQSIILSEFLTIDKSKTPFNIHEMVLLPDTLRAILYGRIMFET